MDTRAPAPTADLVGIGLYSAAEAGRLIGVPPAKIRRWLQGHDIGEQHYEPLWQPQIDLGDDGIYLGFRDLQEVRVAAAFIANGLSARRVRQAIVLARDLVEDDHPLSTTRFRSDGRSIFLQVAEEDGQTRLIDIFQRQYAFQEIIARSLANLDYDDGGRPTMWWPLGRSASIVLDPARSFGQPIEAETSIPAEVLASAVEAEGSEIAAARAWDVPLRAVRRAVAFQHRAQLPTAA